MSESEGNYPVRKKRIQALHIGERSVIRNYLRCLTVFLKISLVLNVLLLAALLVVYVLRHHNIYAPDEDNSGKIQELQPMKNRTITVNNDDVVCLSCDYLADGVPAVDTMYDAVLNTSCNHKVCCFNKQKDILDFVTEVLTSGGRLRTHGYGDSSIFNWWSSRHNSAHLTKSRYSKELYWTTDPDEMAYVNDLLFTDNCIVIPDNARGMYFIYSLVTFDLSIFRGIVPESIHSIQKSNPGFMLGSDLVKEVLVMTRYGGSVGLSNQGLHTSFLHAVFELNEGDIISSKVGVHTAIPQGFFHDENFSNFFGMFKL